jgi:acetyl-CoA carboxylase carboxyltransferase component
MYSKGSIDIPYNSYYYSSINSILYTMNVKVLSDTTITWYNYANDDYFYVYVDDTLEFTGANYGSYTPRSVTLNLSAGNRKIEIVKNDSGSGSNRFTLFGNVISSTVLFLSGK